MLISCSTCNSITKLHETAGSLISFPVRRVTQLLLSSTYSDTQPVAPASKHSDSRSATGLYSNAMISSESLCIFQVMCGLCITEILLISRGINALSFWPGRGTQSLSFSLLALWNPLIHQKSQTKRQKCKILQEKNTALDTMHQLSWKVEKSDRWAKALRNSPVNNSQWVNNFSLVIQLTSSEGSAEEDFVDDVTEDFLAPSSWKGIVALLWRSVFIKHLLPRI